MKKKAVAALLAAGLSLNLCGCSAYGVAMKMMQDYEPEQSQDWAVEAQLPEEEEILESEESEETGNEDAEETVIAGKDQSEKTSVEMPEELSDNLYDFQIAMDGQVYKFPMWFDDFEALGWEYLGDRTEVLYANEYLYAEPWQKDGVTIYTSIANLSLNAIAPEEGQICGLDLDGYQMRNCDWKIELSKGITFGKSAREDILKAYGEPTDEYDGELYYKMSYETDYYSEVTLYVYKDSGVMEKLELMNMIELEGLDNSVSEEVPELISEYKAPTQLGDDYYSNILEYDGALYQFPCPIQEFTDNGFEIQEENSDMVIGAGDTGRAELMKDKQRIRVSVKNFAPYATVLENCFIIELDEHDFGANSNSSMVFPGGITFGSSEEEVLAAIADYNYDGSEFGKSTYYYVYGPDEYSSYGYQIVVEDGKVTSLRARQADINW